MTGLLPGSAFDGAQANIVVPGASDREALARAKIDIGETVYLAEPGREGFFRCQPGAAPSGDRLQGLSIQSIHRDRHFSRIWDQTHGCPEWFGAVPNDWRADCALAIEQCSLLCPVTQLRQADYFVRRTVTLTQSWRTLRGAGCLATDQGEGTRIILQGQAAGIATDDIMLVGSRDAAGRTVDGFAQEIRLSQFTLVRDGECRPHPSGDPRRYPAGLRVAHVVRCSFSRIASLESSVGFYFGGTVYTKVDDCLAQRTRPGRAGGRDLAIGFYLDGSPRIGFAGGNASLYLNRCLAVDQHPAHLSATGLVAEGAFVDSFVDAFECARIENGMRCSAAGAAGPGQAIDLHLRHCVLDGCAGTGIELDLAGTQSASIDVIDPYVYAPASGGARGIVVHAGGGLITFTGGQVHGGFREGSLLIDTVRGVRVQGLKLHEGIRPVVVRRSGALQLEPQISNVSRRTTAFAVTCDGMYRSALRPLVMGASGVFAGGVAIDATCNFSAFDTAAVDPGCFADVIATRKLWFGGSDATRGAGAVAFQQRGNTVSGPIG